MGWLIFVAIVAVLAWLLIGRSGAATQGGEFAVRTEGNVRGNGDFDCEVVGESHYQDNLLRIAGAKRAQSAELQKTATLFLDDQNPHDSKAVKVYIDGLVVGHLSREMARSWRAQLKKQRLPIGNYTCPALIVGGWDKGGGDAGDFGVRLDVPVVED